MTLCVLSEFRRGKTIHMNRDGDLVQVAHLGAVASKDAKSGDVVLIEDEVLDREGEKLPPFRARLVKQVSTEAGFPVFDIQAAGGRFYNRAIVEVKK